MSLACVVRSPLIMDPPYAINYQSLGTFDFNLDLMIKSPMFLCLLYAIIEGVVNKSLHALIVMLYVYIPSDHSAKVCLTLRQIYRKCYNPLCSHLVLALSAAIMNSRLRVISRHDKRFPIQLNFQC